MLLHLIFCALCVPFGCLVLAMGELHEATRKSGNVLAMAILPKELVRWLLLTTTLPKSYDSIFISHFSLTVFRRFHEKWRETTLKNSEIF